MTKKLGVGIIGCGKAGLYHSYWYSKNENCRLVGFYNRTQEKAERLADKYGARCYKEWKELAESPDVDVISLCTPINQHCEQAIFALNLKKHVLCEKPMASNTEECKKMVKAADKNIVNFGVFFNMRFHPVIEAVNKIVPHIGKILSISMSFQFNRKELGWRGNPEIGTGALMELGTHAVDLAIQWAGNIERVYGEIGRFKNNSCCDDHAFALCKFNSGSLGCFYNSYNDPSFYSEQVEGLIGQILGKENKICFLLNSYDPDRNRVFTIKDNLKQEIALRKAKENDKVYPGHMDSFAILINNFINSILENKKFTPSGIDGLKAIEFVEKAYKNKLKDNN
ncbi:MAG: Gfo/Idh/MocA family oxidoreductase [Actinobacteria bacterium]|nr:Gfo/Idh/MocA family oxidoreductase [Actinomycetota bacterium]